jgi:AraC family transcriptional regulator
MLEARYEAPDIHIIPPMIGRVGIEAVGSVDAGFSDRAWTLPHRVDLVRSLRICAANRSDIVITQVIRKNPGHGMTEPQARADAYSARVYLDGFEACDVWCDEQPVPSAALMPGAMLINDMRHTWRANPTSPFNVLSFFIPQDAVDEIAEEQGARRGATLRGPADTGWTDAMFRDLARSLLPALAAPEQANKLFTDHLTRAAVAHLTANYGSLQVKSQPARGGLARWQERRAKEMLTADLAGDVSLSELATACKLSASHFAVSFKRSIGYPPHKWLLMKRVEKAKHLILTTKQPLCEIALDTGFADQSHLTRVFTQHLGLSPGAWRRARST